MRMGIGISLKQTQKLIITPELRQAIAILQLSSQELNDFLEQELLENPVLELGNEVEEAATEETPQEEQEEFDIDWQEYFADGRDLGYTGVRERRSEETSFEQFISEETTFQEHLMMQLNLSLPEGEFRDRGEFLIGNIDDNGYLRIDIEEAAQHLDSQIQEVEDALKFIQGFDPIGVGARDLAECLLLQWQYFYENEPKGETIIKAHLEDLAAGRITKIAKELAITPAEAQSIGDMIKTLDPKPGRRFGGNHEARYVVPEVIVEKVDNEYIVLVNDHFGPRLGINAQYRSLLGGKSPENEDARKYVEEKLNSALWIIRSIEQRRLTLYRVVTSIVGFQRDFLDYGIKHLKPLVLRQVADELEIHESTVSRAIANKYVQTPQGVFELKFFFPSGVERYSGQAISSQSIKQTMEELIENEDTANPLADQALTDSLKRLGIRISRRTVAKYRDEMGIPSASRRKRF